MVLSVKGGGQLTPAFMRELRGVLERESDAEMGGFISLEPPTKGMLSEVANDGVHTYLGRDCDRLQMRAIQDPSDGKMFDTSSRVQALDWMKQGALPL